MRCGWRRPARDLRTGKPGGKGGTRRCRIGSTTIGPSVRSSGREPTLEVACGPRKSTAWRCHDGDLVGRGTSSPSRRDADGVASSVILESRQGSPALGDRSVLPTRDRCARAASGRVVVTSGWHDPRAAAVDDRVVGRPRRDAGGARVPPTARVVSREEVPSTAEASGLRRTLESCRVGLGFGVTDTAVAPSHADPGVRPLAIQDSAEGFGRAWVRPLQEYRGRQHPRRPRAGAPMGTGRILPYFGHAEGVPEAALPPGPHSSSRLFRPLAHCGYQAFARGPLDIRERREVTQELDPREVGDAVHRALEWVGPEARWRMEGDIAAERRLLVDASVGDDRALKRRGEVRPVSAAVVALRPRRRHRWNEHWPSYVESGPAHRRRSSTRYSKGTRCDSGCRGSAGGPGGGPSATSRPELRVGRQRCRRESRRPRAGVILRIGDGRPPAVVLPDSPLRGRSGSSAPRRDRRVPAADRGLALPTHVGRGDPSG